MTHTGVSLYIYLATFLFAAFVAKEPDAHTRLILNAYVWAAAAAAVWASSATSTCLQAPMSS